MICHREIAIMRRSSLLLIVMYATLAGGAAAVGCGMHGYGFGPFGVSASQLQRLPAGTGLYVPRFLSVYADAASLLEVTLIAPAGFDNPSLSVESPEEVSLDADLNPQVAEGERTISLPFVARAGTHRVTFRLSGTVDGEARSLTRHAYVVATNPAADLATR